MEGGPRTLKLFGVRQPSEADLLGASTLRSTFQSDPEVGNPAKALLFHLLQETHIPACVLW